jgi:recombination protein RecA
MAAKVLRLAPASTFAVPSSTVAPCWSRAELAGRLVEISGTGAAAALTCAVGLVLEAQREDEPAVWVTLAQSGFYPPDLADSGVDLAALVVVRVTNGRATGATAARAADRLARSGAFGLIVIDLIELERVAHIPTPLLGRLVGLAQRHDTAIVCLTDKSAEAPSLGSIVSLRAEALRVTAGPARFRCKLCVLKDKRRGPRWSHDEVVRGPDGLR